MKYIAKIEREGLILFFPELRARSGFMVCWSVRDGHNEASTDYYRRLRNPSDSHAQNLAEILRAYEALPPGPSGLVRVYRDSERMYRTRHGFGIEPMADDDSRSYGPHFRKD
jgi:hypothetical protein